MGMAVEAPSRLNISTAWIGPTCASDCICPFQKRNAPMGISASRIGPAVSSRDGLKLLYVIGSVGRPATTKPRSIASAGHSGFGLGAYPSSAPRTESSSRRRRSSYQIR